MSEEHTEQETHVCRGCCGAGENEVAEPRSRGVGSRRISKLKNPRQAESETQEKITVTNSMDLQGSHFLYTQATEKSIKDPGLRLQALQWLWNLCRNLPHKSP